MGKDELSIELINLIKSGENIAVEFKQATNALNKDVYDTICAFCNREGGHIFLGVKDKTNEVLGIDPDMLLALKSWTKKVLITLIQMIRATNEKSII